MTNPAAGLAASLADRYRIERELGHGGMATVYLAEDVRHRRRVAVKVLQPELAETLGAERFLREIEIAAGLSHPHILPLLDSGEADGHLFYVMPYVEGESLRARLDREGELPVAEAAGILKDVVDALAYAHGRGVVHRDIKPDNVMLSGRHALVMDFGVAKAVSAAAEQGELTTAGVALGTPTYMAPEQAAADPHIDHRADIYALGVMAYELLAGQPPFAGTTAQQVLGAHLSQPPEPVTKRRAAVPPALAEVVMRCLEKRPADRWQTAEELVRRLDAAAAPGSPRALRGKVLVSFGLAAALLLAVVYAVIQLAALPDWMFLIAVVLLAIGLPIVLLTGHHERLRAGGSRRPTGLGAWLTWRTAIGGGVLAFAVWGVVATGLLMGGRDGGSADDRRSIAVLPFTDRSEAEGDGTAFFAEGIHDDLLTQLAKIENLTVISRTSVMQYRNTDRNLRDIAAELGVATVLEGAVQRAGDRVRINAQLIDARTDKHLWAETYDQELTAANIFAIQSDLARQIAGALRATLAPQVAAQIEKKPTESLAAYDFYTRGRYLFNNKGTTRDALEDAADLFRQAIAADSGYAEAHAGLADVYLNLHRNGYLSEGEALPPAREAVERALQLDPDLAPAHASLGWLLTVELRFAEAEREFRLALELNPGDASAHDRYGSLLGALDRFEESIKERRRAVELDPLSVRYRFGLLSSLSFGREYEAAIEESQKLIQLEPENPDAFYYLGMSSGLMGRFDQALAAMNRAAELNPEDPYYPAGVAWVKAMAGRQGEALEAVAEAIRLGVPVKEVAIVYGALGDLDRAFELLDEAYEKEPGSLAYINSDPSADPLKADPRFGALLKKIGLKQ